MRIDGNTRLLGILGRDINYTLSPIIHNFSAIRCSQNQIYVPFDIDKSALPSFLHSFWAIGGKGLNITSPYKTLVAQHVGSNLDSVNTLYRGESRWLSASTDGPGFEKGLQRLGVCLEEFEKIIILGNGGVVRGLLAHFRSSSNCQAKLHILGRRESANDLCQKVSSEVHLYSFKPQLWEELLESPDSSRTLVIQATSAPANGDDLGRFSWKASKFKGVFVDLLYAQQSEIYHQALQRGIRCQDGLPMLIEQARLSQQLWWGKMASYEAVFAHLEAFLAVIS